MDNEPIEICYSTSENSLEVEQNYEEFKLTPGIAVFFSFLKATIFYAFLLTAFAGYYIYSSEKCQILDLFPSFEGFQCHSQQEPDEAVAKSIKNVVTICFLVSLVVITIFIFIYKKTKNAWHRKIYSKNLTEESYTILVSNIPVLDFPSPGEKKSEFFYRKHIE
jgi:preprotein translocase subunit Sec61beta